MSSVQHSGVKILLIGACVLSNEEIAGYGLTRAGATWLLLRTDATRIRDTLKEARQAIERKRLEEDDGA